MNIGRNYVLPIGLGVLGMLACHIVILIGFGLGIPYPIYWATYPLIFPLLVVVLLWQTSRPWLTTAIFLNACPVFYWYILLWSDGKFTFDAAFDWRTSSCMLVIMPFTVVFTIAAGFIVSRRHKKRVPDSL